MDLVGDLGTDLVRTRGVDGDEIAPADGFDGDGARERDVGGANVVLTIGLEDDA